MDHDIQVETGYSTDVLGAACMLWLAWAQTEGGRKPDEQAYRAEIARHVLNAMQTGEIGWLVLIATDSGMPVGMVELSREYDANRSELGMWGSSAYVLPRYRGRGVYGQLFSEGVKIARAWGAGVIYATYPEGSGLGSFYEGRGFTKQATLMRLEL